MLTCQHSTKSPNSDELSAAAQRPSRGAPTLGGVPLQRLVGLTVLEQAIDGEPDVFGDLPEQDGRNIPALMKRHGGTSSSTVTKLLVRTTLPDLRETKLEENGDDLCRLENWDVAHAYATATF